MFNFPSSSDYRTPSLVPFARLHGVFGGTTGSGKSGGLNVLMGNLEHYSKPHVIEKKKSPLAASNASR